MYSLFAKSLIYYWKIRSSTCASGSDTEADLLLLSSDDKDDARDGLLMIDPPCRWVHPDPFVSLLLFLRVIFLVFMCDRWDRHTNILRSILMQYQVENLWDGSGLCLCVLVVGFLCACMLEEEILLLSWLYRSATPLLCFILFLACDIKYPVCDVECL